MEHLAEFGNLTIDTELLLFKAFDGGVDDFGGGVCAWACESWCLGSFPFRPILSYLGW